MLARTKVVGVLERLQQRDPDHVMFGAATHGYALAAPLPEARVAAIEGALGVTLPADYRHFVTTVGASGAGPGYGLVPLDHPAQLEPLARPFVLVNALGPPATPDDTNDPYWRSPWLDGAMLLADHGCTYLSVLVIRGAAAGQVWADLRAAGVGIVPTHASFTAWYAEWLRAVDHVPSYDACPAPAGSCSLPNACANFFAQLEQQHGVAPGMLPEAVVRDALWGIGDGAIATATTADRFFEEGPVRLCRWCSAMVDRFAARRMMRWSQLVVGRATRVERSTAEVA